MAKAFFSNNLPLPGAAPSPNPSRPPAGKRNLVTTATTTFATISVVKHAVDRAAVLVRSAPPSGAGAGETTSAETKAEAAITISAEEVKAPNESSTKGGENFPDIPNVPVWARGFVSSVVFLSKPFYKRFMSIEDEVEKTVETVVEVAEDVAKVTKNVVADVAESLPDGDLKKLAKEVEEIAEVAIEDSEKVKSFIGQVDEVIGEVDRVVDSIDKEAEGMFLKGNSS